MIAAVICTVAAWFTGLVIDANLMFNDCGFLMMRVLLPIISMGAFIIASNKSKDKNDKE